jgi:WD40 repeat protein
MMRKQGKTSYPILSRIGVGLPILLILMISGCSAVPAQEGPTQIYPSLTPSNKATQQAAQPGTLSPLQKLRVINQSDIPLYNLVVVFPDEWIEFGDVPGGTSTEYRDIAKGVYRYAAYDVEVNGHKYQQPVVDWMGETPMQGESFTYIIEVDPSRWQTEGQVIKLVQVREDPSTSANTPTPKPSSTAEVQLPAMAPSMIMGKGSPTSLAVSPNGLWMAVSTQFGVYLYYATTFEQSWFTPLAEKAGLVVFNRQSDRLGVATGSGIVILDVVSGDVLARLENAGDSFAWSPDGRRLVSGSGCQQVTVWDASTGAALKELSGGKCSEGYSGNQVTWAADGRIYGVSMGTKILAWDGDTYDAVEGFSAEGVKDVWISAILAAPAGSLLAQYDIMGYPIVAIIDGKQNRQVHLLDQQAEGGSITALAWAQDGQHLAVAYGMNTGLILICNAQTGQVEHKIEGFYTTAGLGWSPDGSTLFGPQSLDGKINVLLVSTGQVLHSVSGHASAGNFLTWTMNSDLVSTNGTILTRWASISGEPLQQETVGSPQEWVVSWPPTGPGTYLFTSPDRGHQVGTLRSKWPLAGDNNQYPFPTAWSFDGSRLADPAHVWDAGTGKLLAQLRDPAQQHTPDQVAWSPDGKRLVSAHSLNMQPPVIWDAQTGKVLLTLQSETGDLKPLWLGLAWSPDGKKLAAVGSLMHLASGADEGMILIWNAETGQQEQLLTAGMHGYRLWAVAWSPDSRLLACGTTGSELFVWNMVSYTPLAILQGHRDIIDRLAWSPSPDRTFLASVARDGTLQIWDLSAFALDIH